MIYKAFGLAIESEIPLPELSIQDGYGGTTDVRIRMADLRNDIREGKFVVSDRTVMFKISDTAVFCIEDGDKIAVLPIGEADMDRIRLYILGTCMGALLMQRRVLPLHGSAIAIDGKAYAIVGNRGAGKSTLTSAFLSKGYPFLSDDVIAVNFSVDTNTPIITPSYPQQKLWQESLQGLGMSMTHYRSIYQRENKYAVPVHTQYYSESLPLAGVFELIKTDNEKVEVHRYKGLERIRTLHNHTFRNFLINRMGLMEWHFNAIVNVAKQVDVFELRRPTSTFTAHELVAMVLSTVKQEVNV